MVLKLIYNKIKLNKIKIKNWKSKEICSPLYIT